MASSSEAMRVLELFELQSKEGPCLDCYLSGKPVVHQDLAGANDRWPRFAAEALDGGFHAVQALPLRWRGTVIGALNLFHVEPGEMHEPDVEAAQALADVATIAVLSTGPRSKELRTAGVLGLAGTAATDAVDAIAPASSGRSPSSSSRSEAPP